MISPEITAIRVPVEDYRLTISLSAATGHERSDREATFEARQRRVDDIFLLLQATGESILLLFLKKKLVFAIFLVF